MESNSDKIQFIDLAEQQRRIRSKIDLRISTVLDHGRYIMGPEIDVLEDQLSAYLGVKHSITCSSGTDALLMILMAAGIGPGHAVFTTPFTFMATAEVISFLGATPVFVDIDPDTFNIDCSQLAKAVEAVIKNDPSIHPLPKNIDIRQIEPKCIIPVDLFGLPADYDAVNAIASRHDLFVLQDAAQSFGAGYKGKLTGNLCQAAATSFFPAKPLGCYGDGGAVFTNDDALADIVRSIRVHGKGSDKYDNVRTGINGRLDTIQAAILIEKLAVFKQEVALRNKAAEAYRERLTHHVRLQLVPSGYSSVWAQFSLIHPEKERLISTLNENQIPTAVYYPRPLHSQTAFAYLGYADDDFPVSRASSKTIFSLPMHPYLETGQIDRICSILLKGI